MFLEESMKKQDYKLLPDGPIRNAFEEQEASK